MVELFDKVHYAQATIGKIVL